MLSRRRALISAAQTGEEPSGSHNLPSAYQEVEYIESTGTQYIDTGIIPSLALKGIFDISTPTGGYAFGSTNGQNIDYWGINFSKIGKNFVPYYGTGKEYPGLGPWYNNIEYNIVIVDKKFYIDDVLLYDFATSRNTYAFNTNKPIYLFALNYNGAAMASFRFKRAEFYTNDVLIANFVPCYRKSDTEIGMYDIVNDVFYTNAGTGTFLKGAKV